MTERFDDKQWLSELTDSQLEGEALARGLDTLARDEEARQAWQAYHLIGDVLRSPQDLRGTAPAAFMARLSGRLAAERPPALQPEAMVVAGKDRATRAQAANDSVFRWKLAAGLASLTAMAAVGWILAGSVLEPAQPLLAGAEQGRMIRDARLDELVQAHRQFGTATGLQTPTGVLHHANFEVPAPRR